MNYLGDVRLGVTLDTKFTTVSTLGAPTTIVGAVVAAYAGSSTVEVTTGVTITVDFDARTGMHHVQVVPSGGNGFATATNYQIALTAGTVGGTTITGYVVAEFSIENRSGLMSVTAANKTVVVDAAGLVDANAVKAGPTGAGAALTARDIGASVLLSTGTGTGQLDFTSGVVKSNLIQILGTVLTETAGLIAAGFKKFFNVATPTGTVNSLPDVVPGAANGLVIAGVNSTITATFGGNLTGSVASVTGAVGSVTGAVGSVTGAVGSVTGNVGGNVVGSVASVTASVTLSAADSMVVRTGTAQAGAAQTITLDASASAVDDFYKSHTIKINSGTGAGQAQTIQTYIGATKVATVGRAWAANPDNTSVFTVRADAVPTVDSNGGVVATLCLGMLGNITGNLSGSVGSVTAAVTLTSTCMNSITDLVWDEALSGHATGGSAGAALSAAGAAADPWATVIPGAYGAGTAGLLVGTALPSAAPGTANGLLRGGTNTTITATFAGNLTGSVGSVTGAVGSVTGITSSDVGAIKTAADAIKVQTDKLVFTVTNQVDANVLDWKSATAPAMTGDAFARLGAPAGASVSADIAAVKVDTAAIKAKTDNLPSDPADESLILAATDAIVTAIAGVQADTDNIQTRIPAALTAGGLMKSDMLAVSGDTTSATNLKNAFNGTGATFTGTISGTLTSVTSLGASAIAQVNAEVVDALSVDTYAEPGIGAPAATTTLVSKIGYIYKAFRNKTTQTGSTLSGTMNIYGDTGVTIHQKSVMSDDGTTFIKGEIISG